MDIASGIAATGNAINLIKAIKDADAAIDTATLKAKLAEVMNALADSKLAQLEMLERIRSLETEIERLRTVEHELTELFDVAEYLYRKFDDGSPKGWPACPTCIIKDRTVSILVQSGDIQSTKCPRCASEFSPVVHYTAPGRTAVQDRNERQARTRAQRSAQIARLNSCSSWMV